MMFFAKLEDLVSECGLTIAQLSKAVDIPATTMYSWQNGTQPTAEKLTKLADYFGCTVDELLGREPTEPAANSIKITPLAKRLLEAFYQIEEVDQHKLVAMAEALATIS